MTQAEQNELSVLDRLKAPTPVFFQKVRNWGLLIAAIGGVMLASPVVAVAAVAGYLVTAGGVMVSVASSAVDWEALKRLARPTEKWQKTK